MHDGTITMQWLKQQEVDGGLQIQMTAVDRRRFFLCLSQRTFPVVVSKTFYWASGMDIMHSCLQKTSLSCGLPA